MKYIDYSSDSINSDIDEDLYYEQDADVIHKKDIINEQYICGNVINKIENRDDILEEQKSELLKINRRKTKECYYISKRLNPDSQKA